jgi:hypothetical protein
MKLEIGKFIRTPYGIRKIVNITKDDGYGKPKVRVIELDRHLNTPYKFDYIFYTDENVIKKCKTSYNIIDILEVGDYVNGSKVVEVDFDAEEEKYIRIDKAQDGLKTILRNNDIKSIVTKEQFENMEYRIGE